MQKKQPNFVFFIISLVVLLIFITMLTPNENKLTETLGKSSGNGTYTYTEIVGMFQKGQVQEYILNLDNMELTITQLKGEKTSIVYKVPDINLFIRDTENYIIKYNEDNPKQPIKGEVLPAKPVSIWISMLPMIIFTIFLIGMWVFIIKKTQGGGGGGVAGFGKSRVQNEQGRSKVRFKDVAGADEEKQELTEVVDFLKNPSKFNMLGARIPKGVILVGPPGTGKTLLAKAVAGEAGVAFFAMSGSDFVEMYVGVGASRVRDLFEKAQKSAPSVIFIDEIDAVGRQRGAGLGGGHDEREQTLNQLLVEMDGFSANTGVIVIAATNRSDVLDAALLRPGRFDRQIMVGYPDSKGREAILKVHSENKPLAPDVDLMTIAKTTVGFTGADLENLMNEAALLAARRNRRAITMEEVAEATIKVVAGPEKKSRVVIERERKITAYHEAGHAVSSYYCPTQDAVHQISIIPRGNAGGYTMNLPEADRSYKTKNEMYEDLVVLMGGRVAEEIILKDVSTGASNDLERATKTARSMVTRYGFSDAIGPVVYGEDQSQVFLGRDYGSQSTLSDKVAAEIDSEIHRLLTKAYAQTTQILTQYIDQLHLVAQYLLKMEKIEKDEFKQLMENGRLASEIEEIEEIKETGVSLEKE